MSKQQQNTLLVAEIGQAHDGSLGMIHAYIDAVADAGIDIIKFQTHIASAESSEFEPFRVNFSYQDQSRYEYWNRMSFTYEQWQEIKNHCDQKNIEFMSTPFSIKAVGWLEKLGVLRYKIGSGDTTNRLLLNCVANTQKPIILSSGMSDYSELDTTISYLKAKGNAISLLQCTTQYPTPLEKVGINNIDVYRDRYNISVGLSDHSGTIYPSLLAVSMGACMIEVHTVFHKKMFGPDVSSSLTIDELYQLRSGVDAITTLIKNPINKTSSHNFNELKSMFGRSLAVNKSLPAGHILREEDLECKKPKGYGIDVELFETVLGRSLVNNLEENSFLTERDLR